MWTVYLLRDQYGKHYTGMCSNLINRYGAHRTGGVEATRGRKWTVEATLLYEQQAQARLVERWLKGRVGGHDTPEKRLIWLTTLKATGDTWQTSREIYHAAIAAKEKKK